MIFVGTEQFSIQLQAAWHISVQSVMTRVDLYFPLKASGIVVSITFLLGQMFICPNLKNIKLTHVIIILLSVDASDILNN